MKTFVLRRLMACGVMAMLGATQGVAAVAADGYPERPVGFIVSFPPGGGNDFLARMLSAKLDQIRGWSVVVENIPGAGGVPGTDAIAKAKPDGYTIGMGSIGTLTINPSLYKHIPFDAANDIAAVGCFSSTPAALVVPADSPVNSVEELIALAKAEPGRLNFGSAGNGTSHHLAAELFANRAGIDIVHVPYAGSAAAVTGLIRSDTHLMFSNLPAVLQQVRAGRLKALAVTSPEPSPLLPEVPPLSRTLPGVDMSVWYAVVAPAGTPSSIIDQLNQAVREVGKLPDVEQHLAAEGAISQACSPDELAAFMKSERERWAEVVKAANVTLQ
mgnify:CR=1 FL=1